MTLLSHALMIWHAISNLNSSLISVSPVFAIQLNESVDVANLSQLMVFVRYVHNQAIEEDVLFCRPLETTTKASDVFKLVEEFFETEKLDWDKLGVCTDGGACYVECAVWFC